MIWIKVVSETKSDAKEYICYWIGWDEETGAEHERGEKSENKNGVKSSK